MKKRIIISIMAFLLINSFTLFAKDLNFTKEKLNVYNITSSIIQNDSDLELTLNGNISVKDFTYLDESDFLDFSNQNIDNEGFSSYFNSNSIINSNINFSSNYSDSSKELISNILIDSNSIAYVKGSYFNNNFIVSTSSVLYHSLGLYGDNPVNQSKNFPYETLNDTGIISCNFSINNISYIKNSSNVITEIKCNFIYICNYNKAYINNYKNLYILVNPIKNKYYISNLINLPDYETCTHNFLIDYSKINSSGHSIYCDKCKWTKIESHKFTYSYEGLINNQCDCGYNNKINLYIYNENNSLVFYKTIDSFSNISSDLKVEINNLLKKDGYKITKYNEQKYIPENEDYSNSNYQWINKGYVSYIPDYVNNVSIKYIPVYEKINVSTNTNNLKNSGGVSGGGSAKLNENNLFGEVELSPKTLNNLDTLLGETPATANYQYYSDAAGSLDKHVHSGASADYYQLDVNGTVPSINWKDSNQNIATVSSINSIVMTQDADYYYFNIDIDYESQNTPYDYTKMSGSTYQVMNGGTLYLSNNSINKLDYSYSKKIVYIKDFVDKYGYGSNTSFLSQHHYKINDSVSLTINEKQTTQKNTYEEYYKWSNSMTSITDTKTYTKDDSGVSDASNLTKDFYLSYKFPFEDVLYGRTGIANFSRTDYGNINTFAKKQILFTGGQQDFMMPKKPDYDMIISADHNQDNNLLYWNDNIIAKIKIKKSDINNYRYLNLYAPTAVSYNINGTPFAYSEANVSWGTYDKRDKLTISHGIHTYHSVHTQNAIDLLQFTYCDHKWKYEKINEEKHKKVCSKCMWEVEEDHDFKYEYDGINNNLCACGHIKNIKHYYEFSSNDVNDYNEILIASKSYIKPNPTKTGYKHIGYKKYLKHFKDMTNPVFDIASTSIVIDYIEDIIELPVLSDYFSTIFKAKYTPIKYKVHINSNNNKHLPINININEYECYYDEEYVLPNYDYGDYIMQGWTIASGSNIVNFKRNNAIKNISNVENDIINLYPVYDIKSYKFKFSKVNNLNLTINEDIEDLNCYINTNYTLPNNINIVGYTFKGWSLTKNSSQIDLVPNANIYNYTSNYENEIILYPVYEKNKYIFKFSEENILNLALSHIDDQIFYYNQEDYLKDSVNVRGYAFKGWSLVATSSNIDFYPNSRIYNYTLVNNKEYILYPVYDELSFTIVYSTQNGTYSNGNNTIIKNYKLSSTDNFLIPSVPSINQTFNKDNVLISEEIAVFKNYTDLNNKAYNSLFEVKSVVYNSLNNNEIFYLHYNYNRELKKYKTCNNSSGSGNSSGGSGGGSSSNRISNNTKPIENTTINITQPIFNFQSNKQNNKSKKEIKSKKTLYTFVSEVYDYYKQSLLIKTKNNLIEFIGRVYNKYKRNRTR